MFPKNRMNLIKRKISEKRRIMESLVIKEDASYTMP
jgi:hypothetical protein